MPDMRIPGKRGLRRIQDKEKDIVGGVSRARPGGRRSEIEIHKGDFLKRPKIFVLVKNFEGINYDVDIYENLKDARGDFREYTGFGFNREYTDPSSERYSEKFSETKIYELDLPGFLGLIKDGDRHEKIT